MLVRLLALGAVALAATAQAEPRERPRDKPVRVKTDCIGDRCAIYVGGYRAGSAEEDDTGRLVIRDKRGRVIAKIERDD